MPGYLMTEGKDDTSLVSLLLLFSPLCRLRDDNKGSSGPSGSSERMVTSVRSNGGFGSLLFCQFFLRFSELSELSVGKRNNSSWNNSETSNQVRLVHTADHLQQFCVNIDKQIQIQNTSPPVGTPLKQYACQENGFSVKIGFETLPVLFP